MIHVGEDKLKCDMAETYHLYITDWYDPPFPLSFLADLAAGLSDDSRIKRQIVGTRLTLEQTLQAIIVDRLAVLAWQQTKDGHKGRNFPESLYKTLEGLNKKKKDDLEKFATEQDFDEWYKNKMR